MNFRKLALLLLLGFGVMPSSLAQIQHVEMSVEGMT